MLRPNFGVHWAPLTLAAEEEIGRARSLLRCACAPWTEAWPLSCPSPQPILDTVRSGLYRQRTDRDSVDTTAQARVLWFSRRLCPTGIGHAPSSRGGLWFAV